MPHIGEMKAIQILRNMVSAFIKKSVWLSLADLFENNIKYFF